jgi:hypothetical protein
MRKRAALAGVAALALGACTEQSGDQMSADADACGASGRQALVGTSVGELDASALPEPRRVIFPGQPVTMDVRAERLNIEIGPDDRVARVFCG